MDMCLKEHNKYVVCNYIKENKGIYMYILIKYTKEC